MEVSPTIAHILGPGGAGKSTVSPFLGESLGWPVIDLDRYFIEHLGDISRFIASYGYREYAHYNVRNYRTIIDSVTKPSIVVLSSGFMTYPSDIDTGYSSLVREIEGLPLSALLLPSLDEEECISIIVDRQLQRSYLNTNRETEEAKIRSRLSIFMALPCQKFLSNISPAELAGQIGAFIMASKLRLG